MSWASASDHWRGLSTVAGDDTPHDSDADDAADDDDEAAFAAVDDDDIAAYDDDDDDDDDEIASTSVATDPAHVRPRREIQPSVTDRDVARCPLDQLRDLVEEYHDVFDGGAAALALKKMATNGMFLVDSTDGKEEEKDHRVVTREDEEDHPGNGGREDTRRRFDEKPSTRLTRPRGASEPGSTLAPASLRGPSPSRGGARGVDDGPEGGHQVHVRAHGHERRARQAGHEGQPSGVGARRPPGRDRAGDAREARRHRALLFGETPTRDARRGWINREIAR